MNVRPVNDYVLLRRAPAEEKIGSIYVPDNARQKSERATVVAVGAGKLLDSGQRIEPLVKTGDTVLLSKWGGNEVQIDGVDHIFVRENEILAVV